MRYWILAVALVFAASNAADAQQTQAQQQRDNLLKSFDNCVLTVSLGIVGERHLAAERSFIACQTEESAVRTFLALNYVQPANIDAIVIRRKLDLKKIILQDKH